MGAIPKDQILTSSADPQKLWMEKGPFLSHVQHFLNMDHISTSRQIPKAYEGICLVCSHQISELFSSKELGAAKEESRVKIGRQNKGKHPLLYQRQVLGLCYYCCNNNNNNNNSSNHYQKDRGVLSAGPANCKKILKHACAFCSTGSTDTTDETEDQKIWPILYQDKHIQENIKTSVYNKFNLLQTDVFIFSWMCIALKKIMRRYKIGPGCVILRVVCGSSLNFCCFWVSPAAPVGRTHWQVGRKIKVTLLQSHQQRNTQQATTTTTKSSKNKGLQ